MSKSQTISQFDSLWFNIPNMSHPETDKDVQLGIIPMLPIDEDSDASIQEQHTLQGMTNSCAEWERLNSTVKGLTDNLKTSRKETAEAYKELTALRRQLA